MQRSRFAGPRGHSARAPHDTIRASSCHSAAAPRLHSATKPYGHTATVLQLLTAGADVNAAGWDGATPLWRACFNKHTSIVMALIKAGASVITLDYDRATLGGMPPSALSTDRVRLLLRELPLELDERTPCETTKLRDKTRHVH